MARKRTGERQPPGQEPEPSKPQQAKREGEGLIWVTEAMIEYQHSRGWFNRRIADGDLEAVQLPGTTKVYLRRAQVERAVREDTGTRGTHAKIEGAA